MYIYIYIYAYILSKAIYKSYEMIIKYHRKKYSGPESTHQDANWRYSDLTGVDEPMGARGGSCSRHRIPFQKPCVCVCFLFASLVFLGKKWLLLSKKISKSDRKSTLWAVAHFTGVGNKSAMIRKNISTSNCGPWWRKARLKMERVTRSLLAFEQKQTCWYITFYMKCTLHGNMSFFNSLVKSYPEEVSKKALPGLVQANMSSNIRNESANLVDWVINWTCLEVFRNFHWRILMFHKGIPQLTFTINRLL